jgi:zinc D-Ala-D-Ala carboxypeptidase
MQLSPHFSLSELTVSGWAKEHGVSNVPTDTELLENLKFTADGLERIRTILHDHPILISSAYRSDRVNAAVGGVANSAHRLGLAADFTCPAFGDVTRVCHALANSGMVFDQLIWEYGRWVHVGFRRHGPQRGQVLTKRKGIAGYTKGLPN